jgi:glutathione S-transferase
MLTVYGYRYSIYLRIVRLVLAEKGLSAAMVEVDPFGDLPDGYLGLHPFGRVPVLCHDDFSLYETVAIARYLDDAFAGPALQPEGAKARARMAQVIAVADAYAYWPLVRQVYAQSVFRPAEGLPPDPEALDAGLAGAPRVLGALETLVAAGLGLGHDASDTPVTLADLHLAPMIGAFAAAPEGAALLANYPALESWWARIAARPAWAATDPGLPEPDTPQADVSGSDMPGA